MPAVARPKPGKKRRAAAAPEEQSAAAQAGDAPAHSVAASSKNPKKPKRKATQDRAEAAAMDEAATDEVAAPSKRAAASRAAEPAEGQPEKDRRGVVHLASLPAYMRADKVRHLLEQFGEIGRVYLAPEDKAEHQRRKRAGGNRKLRFGEGWVEFADRRLAKRVALTLNGTTIGGKKRHNFYRDDMWNIRYLPRFKWHHLKEGSIYNRQVRKARLEQKISQARRENDFFLERVEQAKARRRAEDRQAKKAAKQGGGGAPEARRSAAEQPRTARPKSAAGAEEGRADDAPISARILDSLI